MPLHLGNSTIETIGSYEALAAQPGMLQAVSVVQEPTKLEYITGETIDPTGLILNVTIDGNTYQIGPEGTGDGTNKYIKVDATMGGTILDASEFTGVTVRPWVSLNNEGVQSSNGFFISIADGPAADTVLENNSWETIAQIAAAGKAQEYWNIGDTKKLTLSGTEYTFRIVCFNFQNLASTDAYYEDTTYNNNSKKTGITFMATTTLDTTACHLIASEGSTRWSWSQSFINTRTLPNLFDNSAAASYIKTVSLVSTQPVSPYGYTETSNSKYYLPSVYEMMGTKWHYTYDGDPDGNGQITYFANGNSKAMTTLSGVQTPYWLRSSYDQTGDGEAQYAYLDSSGSSLEAMGGTSFSWLAPMFDI